MATIKIGARLFKATFDQIQESKKKVIRTFEKLGHTAKLHSRKIKEKLRSFFTIFSKKKRKKPDLLLIQQQPKPKPKQENKAKFRHTNKHKKSRLKKKQANADSKNKIEIPVIPMSIVENKVEPKSDKYMPQTKEKSPLTAEDIQEFFREWKENWGPSLNKLDKDFLESASPEIAAKVIANGRLTLKSPYLKAVYNGLKDLEDISDLLENDELAKDKVMPLFRDYWDRGPEQFTEILFKMHDKGYYPTRSGEKKLSLDPRLVPEWLGLVS